MISMLFIVVTISSLFNQHRIGCRNHLAGIVLVTHIPASNYITEVNNFLKQKSMASENKRKYRLQELGGSDFEMVDGEPDIRGWDVKNSSGESIGDVDELIFDAQTQKIRYMVVDLDENDDLDLDDREVLIPIGMANLDPEEKDVVLTNITLEQLRALPDYDEDNLGPEVERAVCTALGRTDMLTSDPGLDEGFYRHDQFNTDYRIRERNAISNSEAESYTGKRQQYRDEQFEEDRKRQERMEEESLLVNRDRSLDTDAERLDRERLSGNERTEEELDRRNEERKKRDERTGNTGL